MSDKKRKTNTPLVQVMFVLAHPKNFPTQILRLSIIVSLMVSLTLTIAYH